MNGVYSIPLFAPIVADEDFVRGNVHAACAGAGRTRAELPRAVVSHSTLAPSTVGREFIAGAENRLVVVALEPLLAAISEQVPDGSVRLSVGWDQSRRAGTQAHHCQTDDGPADPLRGCPSQGELVPPYVYGPLVLYGMPGTGKSHLVRGLASLWSQRRPSDTVTCLTAAEFAGQFVESIEARTVDDWRARLRAPGLFVVEDLGQLVTKPAAQTELAQTLDALADCGAVVVVTSRVAIGELAGLTPRLRSRLVAGLAVGLAPPSSAARVAIVEQLADSRGLTLSSAAARLLAGAQPAARNTALALGVPELAGALAQLELAARSGILTNSEPHGVTSSATGQIDERLVRRYLAAREAPRKATLQGIAAHTARYFALRAADLKSPSRRRAVVVARDMAMYLARQLTGKSLKQIGEYFGGRDHTTVLHGCRKTEDLLQIDPGTRHTVVELRQGLAMG